MDPGVKNSRKLTDEEKEQFLYLSDVSSENEYTARVLRTLCFPMLVKLEKKYKMVMFKIPAITQYDSTKSLDMQVFAENADNTVQFEKVSNWFLDEENTISYKLTKEIPKYKDDWIGVFKENYSSLEDYIVYEYVNKAASPLPLMKSPHHTSSTQQINKYSLTFPELPLNQSSPPIQLIYFSVSEENVQTILGISDLITLVKKETT